MNRNNLLRGGGGIFPTTELRSYVAQPPSFYHARVYTGGNGDPIDNPVSWKNLILDFGRHVHFQRKKENSYTNR